MRIEFKPYGMRVVLSRKNLLALLTKLDQPGSYCTIEQPTAFGALFVSSEPDVEHYRDREPGPMHPVTEAAIEKWSE